MCIIFFTATTTATVTRTYTLHWRTQVLVVSVAETVTGLEIGVGAKGDRYRSDRGGVTSPMRPVVRMAEYAWLPPSPRRHGTTAAAVTPAPRTPGA